MTDEVEVEFTASNEWSVAQVGDVVWVLNPTGTIMNSIREGAIVALREWMHRSDVNERDDEPDEMPGEKPAEGSVARYLDSDFIGKKVRVRTGDTIIIEDVLTSIFHMSGLVRLYFKDTKSYKTLFSQDDGYQVGLDEWVEVIP